MSRDAKAFWYAETVVVQNQVTVTDHANIQHCVEEVDRVEFLLGRYAQHCKIVFSPAALREFVERGRQALDEVDGLRQILQERTSA